MLKRRLIPCLDVRDGKVVKGVRFRDHVVMGEIEDLALRYRDAGADELVFYDITASPEGRRVDRSWVERVARAIDIPFCVAGGIRGVDDAREVLKAGADKVSINSPALERPALIDELANAFGVQCVVVGVDSLRDDDGEWRVRQYTGDPSRTRALRRRTLDWVVEAQRRGAGEIVLNCMGADGVRDGYDIEQLSRVRAHLPGTAGRLRRRRHAGAFRRRCSNKPASTPRWPPACSTAGTSRFPTSSAICRRPACRCAAPAAIDRRHLPMSTPIATPVDPDSLDWNKGEGLICAIVQHWRDGRVLMLGYMNREALEATLTTGKVTFFSRGRQRLWTKGETSGNTLDLKGIHADCDADALLVLARPNGPTCHLGTDSCFGDASAPELAFLGRLDALVARRHAELPAGSYTTRLFDSGMRRMAQKVGEEGVETALAAVDQDDEALIGEAADLVYHLLVLLRARGLGLGDIVACLAGRHRD